MILGFLAGAGRAKRKKMAKRRVMGGLRSLRVKLFGKRELFRSISRIFNASLEELTFVALGNFELPSDDWLRVCFPVVCQEVVDPSEGFQWQLLRRRAAPRRIGVAHWNRNLVPLAINVSIKIPFVAIGRMPDIVDYSWSGGLMSLTSQTCGA